MVTTNGLFIGIGSAALASALAALIVSSSSSSLSRAQQRKRAGRIPSTGTDSERAMATAHAILNYLYEAES